MAARIKLGELLVRAGVLDEFKLKAALAEQQRWGGRLGRILVEMNFVSEDLLVKALSKQLGVARARLDKAEVPNDVLARIDPNFAAQNAICPERYLADKKTLVVAMADPTNVGAIDELRFKTGLRIETSLAGELEITQAIDRLFYGRAPIDGIELSQGIERGGAATFFSGGSPGPVLFDQGPSSPPQPSIPPQPMQPSQSASGSLPPFIAPQPRNAVPPPLPSAPPPVTQPISTPMAPHQPLPRSPSTVALEMAVSLDGAQKKQLKAIRVLLELLIEKGVFSRDEYMALVNKR